MERKRFFVSMEGFSHIENVGMDPFVLLSDPHPLKAVGIGRLYRDYWYNDSEFLIYDERDQKAGTVN